jgi:hypothetical protein
MPQGVEEQIGAFPSIKAEFHLFEVGCQMFRADVMPGPSDPPLEKRKGILYGVGMDIVDDINLRAVVDRLVLALMDSGFNHRLGISNPIVRNDFVQIHTHAVFQVFCERLRLRVLGVEEPQLATALSDADDNFRLGSVRATSTVLDAANVGFVHFDCPADHWLIDFGHRSANTVAEIPSRLIADSERSLNLAGRHSLLRFAKQRGRKKPLRKRKVRVIKNGSSHHAKLIATIGALKLGLSKEARNRPAFTAGARHPFWPPQTLKKFPALFFCSELTVHFNEVHDHGS